MKKIIVFTVLLCILCLTSCGGKGDDIGTETLPYVNETSVESDSESLSESVSDSESTPEELPSELPVTVGFYDEIKGAGIYTRLDTVEAAWINGKAIAILDVIPSGEAELTAPTYKEVWEAAAGAHTEAPVPTFTLNVTLTDGNVVSYTFSDGKNVTEVNAGGYVSVSLYDDVTSSPRSVLLTETTADGTIPTSMVLKPGANAAAVSSMTLEVTVAGSSAASISFIKQ